MAAWETNPGTECISAKPSSAYTYIICKIMQICVEHTFYFFMIHDNDKHCHRYYHCDKFQTVRMKSINIITYISYNRRKFRSQTSDNMERWKAVSREKSQKRKDQKKEDAVVREKVEKSRNIVFFRGFVAPEGRKVGWLKRRVRRHLGRWEMKSCTPLWREAEFEVKRYKTPQRRTAFGSWDVEKVHGVVARSTFGSKMC